MRTKDEIREEVWTALERSGAARGKNVHDKIPAFYGDKEAAEQLFRLPAWQAARVLKSNPDRPQQPVRQRALEEGKIL